MRPVHATFCHEEGRKCCGFLLSLGGLTSPHTHHTHTHTTETDTHTHTRAHSHTHTRTQTNTRTLNLVLLQLSWDTLIYSLFCCWFPDKQIIPLLPVCFRLMTKVYCAVHFT